MPLQGCTLLRLGRKRGLLRWSERMGVVSVVGGREDWLFFHELDASIGGLGQDFVVGQRTVAGVRLNFGEIFLLF